MATYTTAVTAPRTIRNCTVSAAHSFSFHAAPASYVSTKCIRVHTQRVITKRNIASNNVCRASSFAARCCDVIFRTVLRVLESGGKKKKRYLSAAEIDLGEKRLRLSARQTTPFKLLTSFKVAVDPQSRSHRSKVVPSP